MKENNLYGIPEKDMMVVLRILKSNRNIDEIILFGSRAKGKFLPGSDLDIALKGINLGLKDILDAKVELDNQILPCKIDLVLYNRINEPALIEHINRVGIMLFNRNVDNTLN